VNTGQSQIECFRQAVPFDMQHIPRMVADGALENRSSESKPCALSFAVWHERPFIERQREWRETRRSASKLRKTSDDLSVLEQPPNTSTANSSSSAPDWITKVMPWRFRTLVDGSGLDLVDGSRLNDV